MSSDSPKGNSSSKSLIQLLMQHYGKVLLVGGVAVFGWYGFSTVYWKPREQLLSRIEDSRRSAETLEDQLSSQFKIVDRMKEAGSRTLGSKFDEVSARFRDGLSRIGESEGLSGVTVDHGEPVAVKNPLIAMRGSTVTSNLKVALRGEADFSVVRGSLKGTGTLDSALKVLAVVQSQPWIHRVESVTIRPLADRNAAKPADASPAGEEKPLGNLGGRVEIRIEAATLFAPSFAKGSVADVSIAQANPESQALRNFIVARRSLARAIAPTPKAPQVPEVVVAAAPASAQQVPAPQPFAPYEDWKLTGVVTGRQGVEAWFVNVKSGQRLTVVKGAAVLDAVFTDGNDSTAFVEISGKRFEIVIGETLAARRMVAGTN